MQAAQSCSWNVDRGTHQVLIALVLLWVLLQNLRSTANPVRKLNRFVYKSRQTCLTTFVTL